MNHVLATPSLAVYTIGVYGSTAAEFFAKLTHNGIELVCDVRRRRGVRGAPYAYANSERLQLELRARGIGYRYLPQLAPTADTRAQQHAADHAAHITKRQRQHLAPAYVAAYQATTLSSFDPLAFVQSLPPTVHRLALLCVEAAPAACHRSLLAAKLAQTLGESVIDL